MNSNKKYKIHTIIVAAGNAKRFGSGVPKQFIDLGGKSVLQRSCELFTPLLKHATFSLGSLTVIYNPGHAEFIKTFQKTFQSNNSSLPLDFVEGGKERFLSVYNGLNSISNVENQDLVLIHDAARPCTPFEDIESLLYTALEYYAATLALPINDTLRRAHAGSNIAGDLIQRDGLWAIQTPQAFHYGLLRSAHDRLHAQDHPQIYTDDSTLVSDFGADVQLVKGSRSNIKLTTQDDFEMAQSIIANREISTNLSTRTGLGFDVHAFDHDAPATHVILCGVKVPHEHKLKGHSDADVGLHALTDALLGAIGQGDIGLHFPPSDNTFKDMDSAIFLKKAVDLVTEHGGKIANVDITLICERPKITPHAESMRTRVAEILSIDGARVNIKATTTERLGFTGRNEGIAAQAIASVLMPE